MRVIHTQAVQAHAVPDHIREARGPFQRQEPVVVPLDHDPDMFPAGATAQNGMREVVLYECRHCMAVVPDYEIKNHECEGQSNG